MSPVLTCSQMSACLLKLDRQWRDDGLSLLGGAQHCSRRPTRFEHAHTRCRSKVVSYTEPQEVLLDQRHISSTPSIWNQIYSIARVALVSIKQLKCPTIDDFGQRIFEPTILKISDLLMVIAGVQPSDGPRYVGMLRPTPYILCIRYAGVRSILVSNISSLTLRNPELAYCVAG